MMIARRLNLCRIALLGAFFLGAGTGAVAASHPPPAAMQVGGVTFPGTEKFNGNRLVLNGAGLRTYSFLAIRIYAAALYLAAPSHDAAAILASPSPKLLRIKFLHAVSAAKIRNAWRKGLVRNCVAPCHLSPVLLQRFLAALPPMQAGELVTLYFGPHGLDADFNGKPAGRIPDVNFSQAMLTAFIGPRTANPALRQALLGG